jgi:exosortase/archaeosortase
MKDPSMWMRTPMNLKLRAMVIGIILVKALNVLSEISGVIAFGRGISLDHAVESVG